jgi:hypothetical protein
LLSFYGRLVRCDSGEPEPFQLSGDERKVALKCLFDYIRQNIEPIRVALAGRQLNDDLKKLLDSVEK